jgi:hypothetical protein
MRCSTPRSRRGALSAADAPAAMQKFSNRDGRVFGWGFAHEAVSRRPPISLYTIVARTEGYMYDTKVWDLSIVQGAFSVAPCQGLGSNVVICSTVRGCVGV